jgi:nucleotide-binding universal stress UspA family protein
VQVAAVGDSDGGGGEAAEEGAALLREHGLAAEPVGLTGKPGPCPSLAGRGDRRAHARDGRLRRQQPDALLAGSTTHVLLRDSHVPVFIHR